MASPPKRVSLLKGLYNVIEIEWQKWFETLPTLTDDNTFSGNTTYTAGTLVNQVVTLQSTTEQSISTTIPGDTSIPQNTEGSEVFSQSFTPKNASSDIIISGSISTYQSLAYVIAVCLFVDSDTDATHVQLSGSHGAGYSNGTQFSFKISAGSTSARTYKIRIGQAGGTLYVNRTATSNLYGTDKLTSMLKIEEISP